MAISNLMLKGIAPAWVSLAGKVAITPGNNQRLRRQLQCIALGGSIAHFGRSNNSDTGAPISSVDVNACRR